MTKQYNINYMNYIIESTCFDDLLSSHETDIDCGGIYCVSCNQTQVKEVYNIVAMLYYVIILEL